ncbi:hypothetical protein GCM10011401_23420 [Nesterenkonia cremea]|uniref:Uncharacterized protein n=1 Tax=Nesterenkonia cremea TaxID=1882340 RepID=A0A917ERD3_9MICC|nr:hypothetical protein GCM10011401_23420 [Nesterenkonia cremea]
MTGELWWAVGRAERTEALRRRAVRPRAVLRCAAAEDRAAAGRSSSTAAAARNIPAAAGSSEGTIGVIRGESGLGEALPIMTWAAPATISAGSDITDHPADEPGAPPPAEGQQAQTQQQAQPAQ